MPTGFYSCKRIVNGTNEYGMQSYSFEKAKYCRAMYMPLTNYLDFQRYGEIVSNSYKCYLPYDQYLGEFHRGDRCYMIDADLQDLSIHEFDENCENANYEVYAVNLQNKFIEVIFNKIK